MRLKEDSSSYNAIGLKKKYHQEPGIYFKSKKNTKKWCRGKVGVEHKWVQKSPQNDRTNFKHPWRRFDVCDECGKQTYNNVEYWCRTHEVWSKRPFWNEDHKH